MGKKIQFLMIVNHDCRASMAENAIRKMQYIIKSTSTQQRGEWK